ncbi:hypothetical protein L7F22_057388 [Adiantum nelumboides]|nr:hypothetical protein [Adiantum nelumboides]
MYCQGLDRSSFEEGVFLVCKLQSKSLESPLLRELQITPLFRLPFGISQELPVNPPPACPAASMTTSCFPPMPATSNGLFQGDNPFKFALPLLIVQICLVVALSRTLAVLFKPLGQPRVIAEIIGGIILGPSVFGRSAMYIRSIFPKQSITVLDTVADIGLIFFLFLVGLELDLHAIQKTGKQTLSIAGAGIRLPFGAGVEVSLILHKTISTEACFLPFVVFMGVAMSITAFAVLARILAECKLLATDVGQMALSAAAVNDLVAWILLALAIALSGSDKSPLKLLALGFLMNTKGLVELIVLNIGKDRKVLNEEAFAIMVLMAIFTTLITTPSVMLLYKPARNSVPYRRRKLYQPDIQADSELRVLACVYGMPNVHAIINLMEASRGTRKKPLCLYILHLLELTERPSSLMQLIGSYKNHDVHTGDHSGVVLAFKTFGQLSKVNVKAMTALSAFDPMHENICRSGAEKRAAMIILPFDKHTHHEHLMNVNQKVLQQAPCSVGILVDRGIGIVSLSSSHAQQHIAVLFFGGPDCREFLVFGLRMAEHPGLKKAASGYNKGEEDRLDEQCLGVVIEASMHVQDSGRQAGMISYEEREVQNTVSARAELGTIRDFNFVVVGPVGDLLLSQCRNNRSSILVIQQYDPVLEQKEHLTLKAKSSSTSLPAVASTPRSPSSSTMTPLSTSSSSA